MITRINTLQHIGKFSAFNTTPGTQGDFAKFNVIYAHNASGKSTLCDVLRSMGSNRPEYVIGRKRLGETRDSVIVAKLDNAGQDTTVRFGGGEWHNHEESPPIHVFDERFVAENVLVGHHIDVGHRRRLFGLVIGDQGVALQQAVNDSEASFTAANTELRQAETRLNSLIPEGYTVDSLRSLENIRGVDQQITELREKLNEARRQNEQALVIRQRPALREIPVPAIPDGLDEVLSTSLEAAGLVAEDLIRKHLNEHAHSLPLSWVEEGHRAQTGTSCPHCGQEMEGLDILASYRAFFAGELQQQQRRLTEYSVAILNAFGHSTVTSMRSVVESYSVEKEWWSAAAAFDLELPTIPSVELLETTIENINVAISAALTRKQATPGMPVELTAEEQDAIDAWDGLSDNLRSFNTELSRVNEVIQRKQAEAGSIETASIEQAISELVASKLRHKSETVAAYSEYDSAVVKKNISQQAKQVATENLRAESNRIFDNYGARINTLLRNFAVDFQMVSRGVTFRGGLPSGEIGIEILNTVVSTSSADANDPSKTSLANTLSGGDRSALALAFFLATVESDPRISESIVVFDDPYHNQDRSRQGKTIEFIERLAQNAKQTFVFSHDLEFARAVALLRGADKTFCLESLGSPASLDARELPPLPSRAYEQKYKELSAYISNPEDYSDRLPYVALMLRTILEEYLQLKFPLAWIVGTDWFGTMIGKIRAAATTHPLSQCQSLVDDLSSVNEYSQRFHHRSTGATGDIPDARELKVYAEQALKIIHS